METPMQTPMGTKDVVAHLTTLAQLDIDAVHAYSEALERIEVQEVKMRLIEFRSDHERHVTDLSALIRRLGGEAPEFKRDFKGYIIQGMTTLRSTTGTPGALKAMRTNEELTNRVYDKILAQGLPIDVRSLVGRNRDDERRHLEYVTLCIESRIWESPNDAKAA